MIVKEVNGVSRGFKFGTYTFKIIAELTGVSTIEDVFHNLQTNSLRFLSSFYFACAKHYCLSKKQEVDFDEVELSDWLDDLGMEGSQEILTALIKTYQVKNQKAPQETGQTEQQ